MSSTTTFHGPRSTAPAKKLGSSVHPFDQAVITSLNQTVRPYAFRTVLRTDPTPDIFKFTLYWTLIFHLPFNLIAGTYAFFNFFFPPARTVRDPIVLVSPPAHRDAHARSHSLSHSFSQLAHSRPPSHAHSRSLSQTQTQTEQPGPGPAPTDVWLKPPRLNARRSRWTFALLVLLTFLVVGLLSAVVGAAVLACVILGVYRAGGFYVSTCVPFLFEWLVGGTDVVGLGLGGFRLYGR